MKILFRIILLWMCGIMLLAAAEMRPVNGPRQRDSVLASVNGEAILLSEVLILTQAREYEAHAAYEGKRLEDAITKLRLDAANELIDRKLIVADYRKQPYTIANSDVESEIDRRAEQMGFRSREELRRHLRASGEDPQTVRKKIEEQLIVHYMRLRQVKISAEVTPKEVYDYYLAHVQEYAGVERVGLVMLRLDPKMKNAVQESKAITSILERSPERFSELVRRYAPESGDGRLGEIEKAKLRPEFAAAIKDYSVGKVFGPVTLDDGIFWLQIRSYAKPEKTDFEAVQAQIRELLIRQKREKAFKEYTERLRSQAVILYFL